MTIDETWRAERAVIDAALAYAFNENVHHDAESPLLDACATLRRLMERDAEFAWIERTWRDVRQGDIIRPVGRSEHAVRVEEIARWTEGARMFKLQPWGLSNDGTTEAIGAPIARAVSNPDGAIEIYLSNGEAAAIDALGGWKYREGVIWDA